MILSQLWLHILVTLSVLNFPTGGAQHSMNRKCIGISRGREFMLGFSKNRYGTPKLYILVVAFSDRDTIVTISSKFKVSAREFKKSFTITGRGFMEINIPSELMISGTERSKKVIRISAEKEVSVYGQTYTKGSAEGFLGIPTTNLGFRYAVITQQPQHGFVTQFLVIGTQHSTMVNVTVQGTISFEGKTYNENDILIFEVDEAEAVQIQSDTDLTGTIIESNKPISVSSGNECARAPGSRCSHLTEHLIPVSSWGRYNIFSALSGSRNYYRIVAYFNDTNFKLPGVKDSNETILNKGEYWQGRLIGSGVVSSKKPILMMQLLTTTNGSEVNPSFIQVPSEEHFGNTFGFATPPRPGDGYFNFINIVIKADSFGTLHLNKKLVTTMNYRKSDVPGTAYSVYTVQLDQSEKVYHIEQTERDSSPFSVVAYGYRNDESYGYSAGLSLPKGQDQLTMEPDIFREIGGEELTMTVPCIEANSTSLAEKPICKFSTRKKGITFVDVYGYREKFTVKCITPKFFRTGQTKVSVSLDGHTFPYTGIIYVASQEDLKPLLTVKQIDEVINLTHHNPIVFSWQTNEAFNSSVQEIDVMMQDSNTKPKILDDEVFPEFLGEEAIKKNVQNIGSVTITVNDISSKLGRLSTAKENSALSLVLFFIRQSNKLNTVKVYSKVFPFIKSRDNSGQVCEDLTGRKSGENNQPSCPCTVGEVRRDNRFENTNTKGIATRCFESGTLTKGGSKLQCCYNSENKLLVGPLSLAAKYSATKKFWLHQYYDVLSFLACCDLSSNCDKFYFDRESADCSKYEPPKAAAMGAGEPHMVTFDGKTFTFNGAGEFLMASSDLHKFTLQARMEKYRETMASVYTAFVMKTNNSAKVQIQRSNLNRNEAMIIINDEPKHLSSSSIRNYNFDGINVKVNQDLSEVKISLDVGISVKVYIKSEALALESQISSRFQGDMKGLLGNLNEDPADDLQFRNGTVLGNNLSLKEIHQCCLEWMVSQNESIFTYIPPNDYSSYHIPDFAPNFNVPNLQNVRQEIQDLCGGSIECTFDAVTTGSLAFANETLALTSSFEKMAGCGSPGCLQNGIIYGKEYLVNSVLVINCDSGYDLKGSPVLVCQKNGQWSVSLPQCVPSSPKMIMILGGLAVVVVVVGFVAVAFYKRRRIVTYIVTVEMTQK